MTEHERDTEAAKQVSQRYRELGMDEPPRALDATILAAAHREAGGRPAPLVSPGARRRWYLPLAAAAVIVLSVAVTVHMQQEQPDLDAPPPRAAKPAQTVTAAPPAKLEVQKDELRSLAKEKAAPEPKRFTPDPPATAESAAAPPLAASTPPAAAPPPALAAARVPAAAPAPQVAPAERQEARTVVEPAGKAASNVGATAGAAAPPAARSDAREEPQRRELTPKMRAVEARDKLAQEPETPEKWLERIATLRAEGRHEEADKALAEFRQRHPDYRIPEPMLQKVQPRR
jgi:hypothetical protein